MARVEAWWYRARVSESSLDIFLGRPVLAAARVRLNVFTRCVTRCLSCSYTANFITVAYLNHHSNKNPLLRGDFIIPYFQSGQAVKGEFRNSEPSEELI